MTHLGVETIPHLGVGFERIATPESESSEISVAFNTMVSQNKEAMLQD